MPKAKKKSPKKLRFELTYKNAIDDDILRESAAILPYVDTCSTAGMPPSQTIAITPAQLKHALWPDSEKVHWQDQCLIQAYIGDEDDPETTLVGHVFVSKWHWQGRKVLWIVHLAAHRQYREWNIEHNLVEQIREEEPVLYQAGGQTLVGVTSADPGQLQIVAEVLSEKGDLAAALGERKHLALAGDMLSASPVRALQNLQVLSLDIPATGPAVVATGATGSFRASQPGQELAAKLTSQGLQFPELGDGCEYLVLFTGI